jgi:hypothetical protein
LAELLLEPFRVSLEMFHLSIVGCNEHGRDIHNQLPKLHSAAALVRSAHKKDSVS